MTEDTDALRHQLQEELVKVAQFPNFNPGPVLRLDFDGVVLLANRAASAVFGSDRLLGQSWLTVCPGMNDEAWHQALAAVVEPFAFDADVESRCFTFNHVCSPDDGLVFVFGTDVTARRRAEREVSEIARFPDMNPGPVLRMDESATVLLNNAAAQDVFGEDLVGRRWLDICPGMESGFWNSVLLTKDVVPIEAAIEGKSFLFAHRYDSTTGLVFVFGSDITQLKLTERALVQSERMATLGTLAAGVAHELNNPAAATVSAAGHLKRALGKVNEAQARLRESALGADGWDALRELGNEPGRVHLPASDAVGRADAEAELEDLLDDLGVADSWELAPALAEVGIDCDELARLDKRVGRDAFTVIVSSVGWTAIVRSLVDEIAESSTRISSIVNALKGYSYLDQAPNQQVDVHRGLEDTLTILGSKLKAGIVVRREYDTDLPRLPAYGGELNQVWTNLIDNAADAVGDAGVITIATRHGDGFVEVEIADDGPGVPEAVASRIFDPFFTTKPQGKGTGLGLSTSRSIIVDRHGGTIALSSVPGDTRFTVRLPLGDVAPSNRVE